MVSSLEICREWSCAAGLAMLMLFISNQLAVAWDKFSDMAAGWLSAWGHHGEDQKRSFGHCSSLQSLVSILRLEPAQFLHHTGSFVGYLTDIAIEIGSLVMPSHSTMITTLIASEWFWLHIDLWLNYWAWQLLDDCFMFPRAWWNAARWNVLDVHRGPVGCLEDLQLGMFAELLASKRCTQTWKNHGTIWNAALKNDASTLQLKPRKHTAMQSRLILLKAKYLVLPGIDNVLMTGYLRVGPGYPWIS